MITKPNTKRVRVFLITSFVAIILMAGVLTLLLLHGTSSTIATTASGQNLVLKTWNIKFKMPQNLTDVKSYELPASPNDQGITEYYEFTTQRVENLGDQCASSDSNGGVIRLDLIDRTKTKIEKDMTGTPVDNNTPVAGYYYYVSKGEANCSENNIELQTQDRDAIYDMILHPISL